jgi:hypothetical protein
VAANTVHNKVIQVVQFIALQLRIWLLNLHPSSLARQAVNAEEPFTSLIQTMTNVFWIKYVVMIVVQHTQVLITSLRT